MQISQKKRKSIMCQKKILLASLITFFSCTTMASTASEGGFILSKAPTNTINMIIGDEQICFQECEDEYDRCISQIGDKPGGAFYCNYQSLLCYDECEGIGGGGLGS